MFSSKKCIVVYIFFEIILRKYGKKQMKIQMFPSGITLFHGIWVYRICTQLKNMYLVVSNLEY